MLAGASLEVTGMANPAPSERPAARSARNFGVRTQRLRYDAWLSLNCEGVDHAVAGEPVVAQRVGRRELRVWLVAKQRAVQAARQLTEHAQVRRIALLADRPKVAVHPHVIIRHPSLA